jgi:hypothetical protein
LEIHKEHRNVLENQLRAADNDLFAYEQSKQAFMNDEDIADRIKR